MATEWSGVVNTTTAKYLKGAQDLTIRNRLFLAMLKSKGRLTFGESGNELQWQVEFAQPAVESFGNGGTLNFAAFDKYKKLVVDWRGYKVTDMMTDKEKQMNKGVPALIERYSTIAPGLEKSLSNQFGLEFYIDGNGTGNQDRIHGIESFLGAGTVAAGDRVAMCDDSYAGKDTDLGAYGGTWTSALSTKPNSTLATDWPDGTGDSEYDFLSPKLVNYSSTAWGTSSTAWEDNCSRVIRQTVIWQTILGGKEGKPDLFMLSPNLYYGYLNKQESKQRIVLPYKPAQDFGFEGSINQEGVGIVEEYGVPVNTGYGLNFDEMTLRSLNGQLFMPRGPEFDIRSDAYLFALGFFGNMTWNPKAFSKIYPYA